MKKNQMTLAIENIFSVIFFGFRWKIRRKYHSDTYGILLVLFQVAFIVKKNNGKESNFKPIGGAIGG